MPPGDAIVVGGGLAGVLAAEALRDAGETVRVIDDAGRRASDAPCALVHPFVGGSFTPRPNIEAAWTAARAWFLDRPKFVRQEVVRRHLPPTRAGDRLLRSWRHVDALAHRLFPHVVPPGDARVVEYGPVLAVDLERLLTHERRAQASLGIEWCSGRVEAIGRRDDHWQVHLDGGARLHALRVVVAAGAGALALLRPHCDVAALSVVEGTLAWAEGTHAGPFVIHGGHASSAPTRMAWGATYRVLGDDARDPDQALRVIDARLRAAGASLPSLSSARRWTASRLVDARTRTPWVFEVSPGLWSMSAFGSQGCLWGPYSARRLIQIDANSLAGAG